MWWFLGVVELESMKYIMALLVNFNVHLIEAMFKINLYDWTIDSLWLIERPYFLIKYVSFEANCLGINWALLLIVHHWASNLISMPQFLHLKIVMIILRKKGNGTYKWPRTVPCSPTNNYMLLSLMVLGFQLSNFSRFSIFT